MFPLTRQFAASLVEADLGIPPLCGGLHPTIDPDEAIETPGIDVICRGEGEEAMLDFVRALERGEDVSQIENRRLNHPSDVLKEGQEVWVKLLGFDDRGKVRLSMKVVDQETGEEAKKEETAE